MDETKSLVVTALISVPVWFTSFLLSVLLSPQYPNGYLSLVPSLILFMNLLFLAIVPFFVTTIISLILFSQMIGRHYSYKEQVKITFKALKVFFILCFIAIISMFHIGIQYSFQYWSNLNLTDKLSVFVQFLKRSSDSAFLFFVIFPILTSILAMKTNKGLSLSEEN